MSLPLRPLLLALGAALATASCRPCEDLGANLADACLPATAASGTELEIEVREACGSTCSQAPDCTATVDLTTVTVITTQTECRDSCTPTGSCQQRTVKCLLPALADGDYTVVFPGIGSKSLTVAAGGQSACTL